MEKEDVMQKLTLLGAALSFSLLASQVSAQPHYFVGVGLGSSKLSVDYYDDFFDESGSDSDSTTALILRAGIHLPNEIRAYASLTKADYDGVDQIAITGSADKLFPINPDASFYIGGSLGHVSLDLDGAGKENGMLYGVQTGLLYHATPQIAVDVGLSYSMTTAEYKEKETFQDRTYEAKVEFTDITLFRIGVDYKF